MAIAFDNAAGDAFWHSNVSSITLSKTNTGSNLILLVAFASYSAALVTASGGITYNGVALAQINNITAALEGNNQDTELWYLDSPATGANNIVATLSGTAQFSRVVGASYTGKTVSGIDANATAQNTSAATNSPTCNVNVVHSDCWLVAYGYDRDPGTPGAGTATTSRFTDTEGHIWGDSNGVVSTGNQTLAFTNTSATWPGVCSASISAANAGGGGGATTSGLLLLPGNMRGNLGNVSGRFM